MANVIPTVVSESAWTVHVSPSTPAHAPPQAPRTDPSSGVAVTVNSVPASTSLEHVDRQVRSSG
jgi:hypothetical protein